MLKPEYTTQELVSIIGVPTSNINRRAKREAWQAKPRVGKGDKDLLVRRVQLGGRKGRKGLKDSVGQQAQQDRKGQLVQRVLLGIQAHKVLRGYKDQLVQQAVLMDLLFLALYILKIIPR